LGLYPALKEHKLKMAIISFYRIFLDFFGGHTWKVRMTIISFYKIFFDFFGGTHMEGTNNATRCVMVWEASMGQTNKYKFSSLI
jgi:hypothetical protein